MTSVKHLRTGTQAAKARKVALWARIVVGAIVLPLLALTLWFGVREGLHAATVVALVCLAGVVWLLRAPLPEGRAHVPMLTLCAQGIQIEPAARAGRGGPILFLWSEIDRIAVHRPNRGRPYLRIVPSVSAAVSQGLRQGSWVPTPLTRWTRPAVVIPTEVFDCPEAKLIDAIGAFAAEQGLPVRVQNRLDGGLRLWLTAAPAAADARERQVTGPAV